MQNGSLGIEPRYTRERNHWNLPGRRHNNGASIAFADGHAEAWRWAGAATRAGSVVLRDRFRADPGKRDSRFPLMSPSAGDLKDLLRLQETVPFGP